ncbi:PTR2-domain-containing protein, partial [Mycena rebaudengoi]
VIIDYETGGPDVKGVVGPDEKRPETDNKSFHDSLSADEVASLPTDEEGATLRHVAGEIPWAAYLICLVEFAERGSYYGCSGVFANYIQRPLPVGGNGAGAPPAGTQATAGALGMGLIAATGLTKTFSLLAYTLPILGGIMADTKWGRFKTICIGTVIGAVAHIVLVVAGIPSVIAGGKAIAPFVISILLLALGTGFIKACIAPIIADQTVIKVQSIKTLPSGERVIVDPGAIYYWSVNIGAFLRVATTYSEKRIGFWLAYLVPGILYGLMPIVLVIVYPKLVRLPPQGSVVLDAFKVFNTLFSRAGLGGMLKGGDNWNVAKPSNIEAAGGLPKKKVGWVTWDDDFVDELKRTIVACRLFLFLPIFSITNGAPNDLLQNFNSLMIIVCRIVTGFLITSVSMVIAAIVQWRIYETSPCGYYASECSIGTGVSPISIWVQIPLYSLPALAEIFINVTSYEIAYTRAPQRMKGVVFAIVLFMSALSYAVALILSPALIDPNLIWPFVGLAAGLVLCAACIWIFFHHMDDEEAAVLAVGSNRKIEGVNVVDKEKK